MLQNRAKIFFLRSSEHCDNRGMCLPMDQEANRHLFGSGITVPGRRAAAEPPFFCQGLLITIKRGVNQDAVAEFSDHHCEHFTPQTLCELCCPVFRIVCYHQINLQMTRN